MLLVATTAEAHAADPAPEPCVDAQIGADRAVSLGCLNQELEQLVRQTRAAAAPPLPTALDPHASPTSVGLATQAAAQQSMGKSFGVSATPQRPSTTFTSPLLQITRR